MTLKLWISFLFQLVYNVNWVLFNTTIPSQEYQHSLDIFRYSDFNTRIVFCDLIVLNNIFLYKSSFVSKCPSHSFRRFIFSVSVSVSVIVFVSHCYSEVVVSQVWPIFYSSLLLVTENLKLVNFSFRFGKLYWFFT